MFLHSLAITLADDQNEGGGRAGGGGQRRPSKDSAVYDAVAPSQVTGMMRAGGAADDDIDPYALSNICRDLKCLPTDIVQAV